MNELLQKTDKTVIIAIPVLLIGGTEIQTLEAVRILIKDGYKVTICCYYEYDSTVVAEFESAGATILLLKLARSSKIFSYRQLFELFRILYKTFQAARPDVVQVQYVAPGLVPILAAKLAGVNKIFATIHYPRHVYGKREESFVRIAARLCTMFFCNSLATERSWFGSGILLDGGEFNPRLRHCTIYNAIDIQRIERHAHTANRADMKKRNGMGNKLVVGIVARLRSEKGHTFLFHSMKQVFRSAPNTLLAVVGDGPDALALRHLANQLEIAGSILWLGAKSQDETFALYGMMDVVVVPSEFEGFGLSAAEAMAAGVPVVASNVDGLREVVEDGVSGILVPFGDVEKMSSSLLAVLFDAVKAKEMGKKGRRRVEDLFSLARFEKAISAAYEIT
jgi:glycosyltransferase involved in cell wall biosynthesis